MRVTMPSLPALILQHLQVVRCPGNLVISAYVCCPDITATVTPDLKLPGVGVLLHVPLAPGHARLGGSALAQAFGQVRFAGQRCHECSP